MAQNNRFDFFRHPLKFFNSLVNGAQNRQEKIDSAELPSSNSLMLGKHNVSDMMALVASNAWYGGKPTKIDLFAGDNVVTIEGYIYEPIYEDFSTTSSISLNGKVLFGDDSRSVAAYRHETFQKGVFETAEEAISHIIDVTKGLEFVVDKVEKNLQKDKEIPFWQKRAAKEIIKADKVQNYWVFQRQTI